MKKMMREVQIVPKREKPSTIYRVLKSIREEDPGSYSPQLISIGPYHHDNSNSALLPMQQLKWVFLRDLVDRHPGNSVDEYIKNVRSLEEDARRCYSVPVVPNSDAFVEMMVLDGCFIIEFLLKLTLLEEHNFMENWYLPLLKNDLLLLENQIPFAVLECIFSLTVAPGLIVKVEEDDLPIPLMDLALGYVTNRYERPLLIKREQRAPRMTPSATKLFEAGVKFQLKKDPVSLLDVSFGVRDGIMEIPLLSVQAVTISQFRNLVAFEHCCPTVRDHFTSYALLMHNLINTPEDAALLDRTGILESNLGGYQEVSQFFNSLVKGAYLEYENHYFVGLFKDVKEYSAKKSHRWRAKMMHDYFNNPWSVISLVAAVVLLVLTLAQTVLAFLAYLRPTK